MLGYELRRLRRSFCVGDRFRVQPIAYGQGNSAADYPREGQVKMICDVCATQVRLTVLPDTVLVLLSGIRLAGARLSALASIKSLAVTTEFSAEFHLDE